MIVTSNAGKRFHLFYDGPFCQWAPVSIVIDLVEYNCAEQYMMAQKARIFGDADAYRAIMNSPSPMQQKAIGREVKGFKKVVWERHAKLIVYRGNFAKFTQSEPYRKVLFDTAGSVLVEASPTDKIWGIGLDEYDSRCADPRKWKGLNWLGEILTQLRSDLILLYHPAARDLLLTPGVVPVIAPGEA